MKKIVLLSIGLITSASAMLDQGIPARLPGRPTDVHHYYPKSPSYKGRELTPAALMAIMSYENPIPDDLKIPLASFIKDYQELTFHLMHPQKPACQMEEEYLENLPKIKAAGLESYSKHGDYRIRIPGTSYCLLIASGIHRNNNKLTTAGHPHYDVLKGRYPNTKALPDQELNNIMNALPQDQETYQGPSRVVDFLLVKKIIEEKNLKGITISDLHMVAHPQASNPGLATDANVMVIEKDPVGTPFDPTNPALVKVIKPEVVRALCVIAAKTKNTWEALQLHMFVNEADGSVLLWNRQHPNAVGTHEAFLKKAERNDAHVNLGREELRAAFKEDAAKLAIINAYPWAYDTEGGLAWSDRALRRSKDVLDKAKKFFTLLW